MNEPWALRASILGGDKRGCPACPDLPLADQQMSAASPGERSFTAAPPSTGTGRQAGRLGGNAGGGLGGEGAWGGRADGGARGHSNGPSRAGVCSAPRDLPCTDWHLSRLHGGPCYSPCFCSRKAEWRRGITSRAPPPRQLPSGATVPEHQLVSSCRSKEMDVQGPCPGRSLCSRREGGCA